MHRGPVDLEPRRHLGHRFAVTQHRHHGLVWLFHRAEPDEHDALTETPRSALAGHGRDPARLDLAVEGGFGRCPPVTAVATYPVPAVTPHVSKVRLL